jgi:phosphate transport system substrate-binding protein
VRITVGVSGTGGGFEKFCAGETDISDASRQIEKEEIDACKKEGVTYEEVQVANDGIANVVNLDNDWATCLTVAELKKIWDKGSDVNNWNQVRSDFPDQEMKLFGAGTDSGTFDYYTESINGEEGRSRSDYSPSEDDNVTVQGVSGDKGNLGYFGLSYALENEGKVKTVEVDDGDGCVAPTNDTVQNGTYKPLSRPLFIYPSAKALQNEATREFVQFYVDNYDTIAEQAKFVPLTDEQAQQSKDAIAQLAG